MTTHSNSSSLQTLSLSKFIKACFKGVGQIMFQDSAVVGIIFLFGISTHSLLMGLAAFVSSMIGTATAWILKFDRENLEKGIYGFSASLIGVALILFFQPVIIVKIAIVVGAIISSIFQHICFQKKLPVYTFPFVLLTWIALLILPLINPSLLEISDTNINLFGEWKYLGILFRPFGMVIFQSSMVAGVCFLIAILLKSPFAGIYAFIISNLLTLGSFFIFPSFSTEIIWGMFSFNSVLCVMVFTQKNGKGFLLSLFSSVISVFISFWMLRNNLIQLTFPFVLAVWITLFIDKAGNILYRKIKVPKGL